MIWQCKIGSKLLNPPQVQGQDAHQKLAFLELDLMLSTMVRKQEDITRETILTSLNARKIVNILANLVQRRPPRKLISKDSSYLNLQEIIKHHKENQKRDKIHWNIFL